MKSTDFQHNFENVVSFDDGETVETVTVAYDYLPEEDQYAEVYDLFIFDATGANITYDVPQAEYQRLLEETKADYKRLVAEASEYVE
jgi:5,10-methenyltetrahydromethanopterin hydrogenase